MLAMGTSGSSTWVGERMRPPAWPNSSMVRLTVSVTSWGVPKGITVWVPTKLSNEDKQILDRLADSEAMTPPTGNKSFFDKLRETLGV